MKKAVWFKRILGMALVIVLLTMSAMPALAVGQSSTLAKRGDWYYVIASRLNVRKGPGIGYGVVTKLPRGTKVMYYSMSKGWWKIYYAYGKSGYVDKQYLTPVRVPTTGYYRTTARLNVRSYPNLKYKVIGVLSKGVKVQLLMLNGDWAKIYYTGHIGWVAVKYLKRL